MQIATRYIPEQAKKALDEAKKAWSADREILINGLDNYQPYVEAIASYEIAAQDNASCATGMINAIKLLKKELDRSDNIPDFKSLTYNDSLAIFNALVMFAQAREKYLDYTYDKTKESKDLNMFRYAKGKNLGNVVNDSLVFSNLNWDDFIAHKYDYKFETGTAFVSGESITDNPPLKAENGLANIMSQLLGPKFAVAFSTYPINTSGFTAVDLATGLYGGRYAVDSYDKPTTITKDGKPYEPKALTTAKKNVKKQAGEYIKVYNRFWGENIATTTADAFLDTYFTKTEADDKATALAAVTTTVNNATNKVKDAGCYDETSFTEPYNVVSFSGADIIYNDDLGTILVAVDPNSTGVEGCFASNVNTAAAIFTGPVGKTEFYTYMKALFDYNESISGKP